MKAELQAANQASLSKSVQAMEIVIDQIGNSFMQFISDSTYRDYAQFPRGDYYEKLNGALNAEDMPGLQKYLSSKAKLSFNIDNLRMSSSFIDSVYMYDRSKQIMLTQSDLQYPFDRFYDKDWDLGLPEKSYAYPIIMDVRSAIRPNGSLKLVIPLVFRSSNEDNYIVFNLDAQLVYDNIFKRLDDKQSGSILVYSKENKLMLYDHTYELVDKDDDELQKSKLFGGSEGALELRFDNNRHLATLESSSLLGWTFVSLTDLDVLYTSINNLRGIMATIGVLLFVATTLLVLLTSRSIYNPIHHLLHYVSSNSNPSSASPLPAPSQLGELRTIRNWLVEAYEDRKSLQVRLNESLPAYREKFLHTLIKAGTLTIEEISEGIRFLDIDLHLKNIMLLLIRVEEQKEKKTDVERRSMNKLRATEIIGRRNVGAGERKRVIVKLNEETFALLVNCRENEFMDIFSLAERIQTGILTEVGLHCSIGIGTYCQEITDLKIAYEEAVEALSYRDMTGQGDIIYIEDIRPENGKSIHYPKDKEDSLLHYIKTGDPWEATRVLNELIDQSIEIQGGKTQFRQMQQTLIRLLVSLIDTAGQYGIDLQKTIQVKHNLYSELLHKGDLDEIRTWFTSIVSAMSDLIGTEHREKTNRLAQEVMAMIEQNYGNSISLTMIAERLGLNPSYLSRSFKEKTGQTFLAYLTTVRIEKSKEMLIRSDLKVKDISEQVGYVKVNYFIKLFKECTGTTPGEFRKMHR